MYVLPVAVAPSSSYGKAIRCVLPVLWMTSGHVVLLKTDSKIIAYFVQQSGSISLPLYQVHLLASPVPHGDGDHAAVINNVPRFSCVSYLAFVYHVE